MTIRPSRAIAVSAALATALLVEPSFAQSRDQIRIVGSSTVFPFATAVAENFGRTTQFKTPVIEATGSGGGIKLFCAGVGVQHPDIANSSRPIKATELADCAGNGVDAVTEVKIGYDGIVIANSLESEITDYTRPQIFLALAKEVPMNGEIVANPYRLWSEIDPDLPEKEIAVFGPPPTSGTRDAFVELVMEEGCAAFETVMDLAEDRRDAVCRTMREDGRFVEAGENDNLIVQRLEGNPEAYGIFGYSFLEENADRIRGSLIEGVEPEFDAIADGDYPVSRSLFFYVKNAHAAVIPGMRAFIGEFVSERAMGEDGYLIDKGLIPLPEEERETVRESALTLTPMDAQ